ncbi:hypothetical protein [Rubinisphaera margarita]|uniref:hypothetical protein n=1 Tax=Rubinisphaera margarita TaxID=2909586 RepID=UPI001EE84654|nr:hypothetical protein [Rubinisphaera margarita]MCG6158613.1 hypothetical protein [Rubinisphaera margarita]
MSANVTRWLAYAFLLAVSTAATPAEAEPKNPLDDEVQLLFLGTPLDEAVGILDKHPRYSVALDLESLKAAGVEPRTPIDCKIEGVKLRDALTEMLKNVGLKFKWVAESKTIVIFAEVTNQDD